LCGVPDVCAADDPGLGVGAGVWVMSCCESKKDNDSTAIALRRYMIHPSIRRF
jgi:hypothetical protein